METEKFLIIQQVNNVMLMLLVSGWIIWSAMVQKIVYKTVYKMTWEIMIVVHQNVYKFFVKVTQINPMMQLTQFNTSHPMQTIVQMVELYRMLKTEYYHIT